MSDPNEQRVVSLRVNGRDVTVTVPVRESLADALRERLQLTGTHLGCEQGVCGSCTVLMNGGSVRSCTTLAVQAEAAELWTVEGLSPPVGLNRLQRLLADEHGLQCGFCTPGIVVSGTELLATTEGPLSPEQVRSALSGNICRCTGYDGIVSAIVAASHEPLDLPEGVQLAPADVQTGEVTGLPPFMGPSSAVGTVSSAAPDWAAGRARSGSWELVAALVGVVVGAFARLRHD